MPDDRSAFEELKSDDESNNRIPINAGVIPPI